MLPKPRTPLLIVLRANLRRQAGPLVALVVAGVIVSVVWDGLYARGMWRDTGWVYIGEMCGLAARTVGVGSAALLAAWQGGAESRDDAGWAATTAARGGVSHHLLGLASGVLWPSAGYLLAMTVMVLSPYPQEPVGRAPLDTMAVDEAMLGAFACLAYLLGRTVPLRGVFLIAAPVAVILCVSPWGEPLLGPYVYLRFTYTGDSVPGGTALGAPPGPPVWLPWCRAALFTAVAATAVLLCARRWKASGALILMLVAAIPVMALTPEADASGSVLNTRALRCSGTHPAVCVSSAYEERRRRLELLAAHLSRRLEGVGPTHYLLTEDSLYSCRGRNGADSGWTFGISPRDDPSLQGLAECVIGSASYPGAASPEAHALYRWLTQETPAHRPTADERSAADRLARLSHGERSTWIDRYLTAVEHDSRPPRIPEPDGVRLP
ncbi:hypothetical protein OG788_03165 [Streptomyces sp. NBC_00647]|uniref:hypothetical protein n=1 Tax=Streptomyces sp. NBC_00647 TaxID=2975796 RepID=UPI003255E628